jgi:hypothetical protein
LGDVSTVLVGVRGKLIVFSQLIFYIGYACI